MLVNVIQRPTDEPSGLCKLIAHRECVQATDTLEAVHKRFTGHEFQFMLVMEGDRFVGLCERQKIGMVLGARYGFAMHSRQPVTEALLSETTLIHTHQSLPEVLTLTCSRPDASLYDDVVLVDGVGKVLGLIFSRTLVRLQNGLLQEKIKELNTRNSQMEGDLQLAREIQLAMLPENFPEVSGDGKGRKIKLKFGHRFQSAGVVSGDFFHVLKISETTLGIFICDVMGHGVRSAFVTAVLRALVEEMRALGNDPAELLSRVNNELMSILKPLDSPLFTTAFYLVADTARAEIRFTQAGHPQPLRLQRSSGEVQTLQCNTGKGGPALALMRDAKYTNCESPLAPGDLILLFTDGIYEVFDAAENEFGRENMILFLKENRNRPMDALLDGLLAAAQKHSAAKCFDDDVCLIAMEVVLA